MDTQESLHIEKAILEGHDLNERCSYDYDARKESYKGGVKGKLGGIVIGAVIGSIVGLGASFLLPLITGGTVATGALVAAFAAGGMLYGAHEFGEVGKIAGSNAAVAQKLEHRIKSFEEGKFAELKRDISEIKAAIGSKNAGTSQKIPEKPNEKPNQTTEAQGEEHCTPPVSGKLVFWKVAMIGLLVGAAAGAILALGGAAEHVLHGLGAGETMAASMGVCGLIGASFGINRDIFWNIFDKTDLLFKGILPGDHAPAKAHQPEVAPQKTQSPTQQPPVQEQVFLYSPTNPSPNPGPLERRELEKLVLLGLDHQTCRSN